MSRVCVQNMAGASLWIAGGEVGFDQHGRAMGIIARPGGEKVWPPMELTPEEEKSLLAVEGAVLVTSDPPAPPEEERAKPEEEAEVEEAEESAPGEELSEADPRLDLEKLELSSMTAADLRELAENMALEPKARATKAELLTLITKA